MLKQRIKKIEKELRVQNINRDNVEYIYKFFLTGDESFIPEEPELKEVQLAADKAKSKGIKECPGLLRIFSALKELGERIDDENALVEYLKSRIGSIGPIFHKYKEEDQYDKILKKLGLGPSIVICPVGTKKN